MDPNTAALQDSVNATQAELDAAVASGATDAELDAIRATLQTNIDALEAAEAAELPTLATKQELDAHIADAEKHLPTGTANQYVRRNPAGDAWEAVDLEISPDNLKAGPGVPGAGIGADGDYYQQIDAALGANDVWGPKAAGAWPAQADFKTADPETSVLTDFQTGAAKINTPMSHTPQVLNGVYAQRDGLGFFRSISADFDYSAGVQITLAAAPGATVVYASILPGSPTSTQTDEESFTLHPSARRLRCDIDPRRWHD